MSVGLIFTQEYVTLSFGALARGLKSERSEPAHVLASQRPKGVPTAFCVRPAWA